VQLRRLTSARPFAWATLSILFLLRSVGFAQDVTEPALKAAFIYNFVRFTEWPAAPAAADPFVMCVLGDAAVGDALERTVRGRDMKGHPILVSRTAAPGAKPPCQVLYVSGNMANQRTQLIAAVRDTPVLTMSDIEGFGQVGGIVQFFFEHGRLRFAIERDSATRAGLRISSRLLMLSQQ
jgi:hypothetical protein